MKHDEIGLMLLVTVIGFGIIVIGIIVAHTIRMW